MKAKCKKCKREFEIKDMVKVIEGYACLKCWGEYVEKNKNKKRR